MTDAVIGVLGLQGAIEDHEATLAKAAEELGIEIEIRRVILPDEIEEVDGLVMPGGESTAMTLIGEKNGMLEAVRRRLKNNLPAFGTCAGAILLSQKVRRDAGASLSSGPFPILDVEILRNGYGRQRESFSTNLEINDNTFHGIFIRAPVVAETGDEIEILAKINDDPVFVKQGNIFATTFHPELSNDTLIHKMFLERVMENKETKQIE